VISVGEGDLVTAGDGADTVVLGDWLAGAQTEAEMMDFDGEEDTLVLVYDDMAGADAPDVGLETDETEADVMHVLLDGVRIMSVQGGAGLTLADIQLLPQSVAEQLIA
jgi:hypothetical protein